MNSSIDKITVTLRNLLLLLTQADYLGLEQYSHGVRLTADEMRIAIEEYGGTIVMPPDSALDNIDVIEIDGSNPAAWSLRFDLWTKEEGQSDLSIELTLIDSDDELLVVEIDNIHVL